MSQFLSTEEMNWCTECRVNWYESICVCSENEVVYWLYSELLYESICGGSETELVYWL